MTQLVLSEAQVAELARSRLKSKQLGFLRANGIRHYLDAHGWPVVLVSAVEAAETAPGARPAWKPNKAA